ncbi:Basic secretory protease (Fragments) [Linum perenne]
MAEFVRLKAHYAPRMVGMGPGRTDNWDEGYGVTAMFLDYCNNLKDGMFVAELNRKSVDVLWQDYKSKYMLA